MPSDTEDKKKRKKSSSSSSSSDEEGAGKEKSRHRHRSSSRSAGSEAASSTQPQHEGSSRHSGREHNSPRGDRDEAQKQQEPQPENTAGDPTTPGTATETATTTATAAAVGQASPVVKKKKRQIPGALKVAHLVVAPQLVSPTDVPPPRSVARPGSITSVDLRHSTTLAASQVGASESTLRELARRGMADVLAFHRGVEERVMKDVTYPETAPLKTAMLFDSATGLPNLGLLRKHLIREGRLSCGAAKLLLQRTAAVLRARPNVARVAAPVVICGDLHGQFYDMLTIFDLAGQPSAGTKYLFLGDYVDRGFFSTEIVFYLCAMVLCHPDRVVLLRGNHETRLMCEFMTFFDECKHKYNEDIYEAFQEFFQTLQIAAVVSGTPNGDCLCVHGGIGPELRTLADFEAIDRFCEIPKKTPFWDVVWADPLPELDSGDTDFDSEDKWEAATFLPNTFRHSSVLYGLRATRKFLKHNRLCTIIRGHQVQQEGYFEHFACTEQSFAIAPVLTVFSAPNYCDQYGNRGAFIQVQADRFVVQQFYDVAHPHVLPGFEDAITWSLPMLLEGIVSILQKLVLSMINQGAVNPESLTAEERAQDEALARKTHRLLAHTRRLQAEKAAFRAVQDESYHKNMSLFESVLRADSENEACPAAAASPVGPTRISSATKKYSSFRY